MSEQLANVLGGEGLVQGDSKARVAEELKALSGVQIFPRSVDVERNSLFFLGRARELKLGVISQDREVLGAFEGETSGIELGSAPFTLLLGPASSKNAKALRQILPYLAPRPLGLAKSIGCGDRLGFATPGHAKALESFAADRAAMAFIPAQQSIRENARTGRTPQEVLDDAMWGVFRSGWRHGYGADADHLKTPEDIDACVEAGFTFFTIDPGEHVDNQAESYAPSELQRRVEELPWESLETTLADVKSRLVGRAVDLGAASITLGEEALYRALVKYGRAVAHVARLYRRLVEKMGGRPFELEVSVDETESVTTVEEHVYVASELKRLGVKWVSLAPRYVGRFEKGVDYIGDLAALRENFKQHFAVAQAFGPYKLSLHSGSDKFSAYPLAREAAGDLVHLKTAGTSYLEALRTLAALDPDMFRAVFHFALDRYETDRASYLVSGSAERTPPLEGLADWELPELLEHFDARQILHVTFGSVLNEPSLSGPFIELVHKNEELYHENLATHFKKHIAPFVS